MEHNMADERRANGRRFGRRRKSRGDQAAVSSPDQSQNVDSEVSQASEPVECPLCNKPIYDLASALADKESGGPVHFDCALRRVADRETLAPGEKLVYIGSGAFAVVEFKDKAESAFTVKRRLPFEEDGKKQDWRRAFSSRISNI